MGDTTAQTAYTANTLRIWGERLYREYDNIAYQYGVKLYPAVVRVESMSKRWGTWDALTRSITVSTRLIQSYPWDVVIEILKHEMAHQVVSEVLGGHEAHGAAFARACDMLGVAPWARTATGELPERIPHWKDRAVTVDEERLLKRVEKLLALATSSNEHEALLAMERVREIYAKHNLEQAQSQSRGGQAAGGMVYLALGRKRKRMTAAESMIVSILVEHYFVQAIFCSQYDAEDLCDYKVVEVLGTSHNVTMAEYVYHFLWTQQRSLWLAYRDRTNCDARHQQSYVIGVLSGFRAKLRQSSATDQAAAQLGISATQCRALVRQADARLEQFVAQRHPRLTSRRWGSGYRFGSSFAAGHQDGQKITINKGVTGGSRSRGLLITGRS